MLTLWTPLSFAANTDLLADTIMQMCEFVESPTTDEKIIECGVFVTNCVINKTLDWKIEDVIQCHEKYGSNSEKEL